jgi:hypothetical protein
MLTSISLFASANAGELGVSGTAKATYNIHTGKVNQGKGLGITNELNFTAAGELDNGYSWSYSMELDPQDTAAGGASLNDDTQLKLTMGDMGTVAVMITEGGLDVEDAASQSAYSRPTDMGDPSATDDNYTIDSYNNVQYHTPADLLPFSTTFKIAFAPDLDTTNNSGNGAGLAHVEGTTLYAGRSATEYQIKSTPIDGLNVGASYITFDKQGLSGGGKKNQEAESGAYFATYALGNITIGYSKAYRADLVVDGALTTALEVEYYDQTNYSVGYVVNDDLSVSYEVEKSEENYQLDSEAAVEQKSTAVQLAYNMGGMTIALARNSHDNNAYVTGANQDQTVFAVTMAF